MNRILLTFIATFNLTMSMSASCQDWKSLMERAQQSMDGGNLEQAETDYKNAEKLLEQSQAKDQDELKKFGFSVVDCLVGIARVKDRKGDSNESEEVYLMALETLRKLCKGGYKSQEYADYIPGIVELYERHGKTQEAENALKQMIETRTTIDPKDDSKIMATYELYSKFLRSHSRQDEASTWETKVLQMKSSKQ